MRTLILLGLIALAAHAVIPIQSYGATKNCSKGPTFWCKNITTAAGCNATKHCIQTVWEHMKLPPDHSNVCETCLEMVKEARDQLLSNETQEEIKEVFDGSCKLLPIKIVAAECCKLADEFIPELIDTLASQMNPQVVCSVAGLCNNERIIRLIEEEPEFEAFMEKQSQNDRCHGCHVVAKAMEKKFDNLNKNEVLQSFLKVCGSMGSLSDACSNIIITYFNEIYKHLQENLNPVDFCLMAGECSAMFHTHANVEITPNSRIGFVSIKSDGDNDDLPCDLCKQLVHHLQDVLVANTTENEFHRVLTGFCKQTKAFKDECLHIVDEYYPIIYDFLTNQLNGSVVCSMVGICPQPGVYLDEDVPIVPLLPIDTAQSALLKIYKPNGPTDINSDIVSIKIMPKPEHMQLPIERLMPQTLTMMGNTNLCAFCEYFLHYVQQAITDPATERDIKNVVDKACEVLPSSVNVTCRQFVDTYGSAFIALLAQDIDPSVVCPKLSLCPSSDAKNVEVFINRNPRDKPNCPLCLLAISSLEELIKNKKSEENIRKALGSLCSHLKNGLREECDDFVQAYTDEIVEACIAQLSPQEICVYLKLCEDKVPPKKPVVEIEYGGSVATNEILDNTISGKLVHVSPKGSSSCVMCEFVMSQIREQLKNNATEKEIITLVHDVCNFLPRSVEKQCSDFVDEYADMVIALLLQSLDPKQVCEELRLCKPTTSVHVANDLFSIENVASPQCTLCKLVMTQIERALQGKVTEDKIIHAVHNVCNLLPSHQSEECNQFIDKNGKKIIDLLELAVQPGEVCSLLFFCASELNVIRLDVRKCAVCEVAIEIMHKILENPNVDHSIEHVLEKSCRALPHNYVHMCQTMIEDYGSQLFNLLVHSTDPSNICGEIGFCGKIHHNDHMLGKEKCTWGPSYWCLSEENASKCGSGATKHCQKEVWKNQSPNLK